MKMKKKMSLQEFEEIQGSVIDNFRNLDVFSKVEFVTDLDQSPG
jgi:hypothetical protein